MAVAVVMVVEVEVWGRRVAPARGRMTCGGQADLRARILAGYFLDMIQTSPAAGTEPRCPRPLQALDVQHTISDCPKHAQRALRPAQYHPVASASVCCPGPGHQRDLAPPYTMTALHPQHLVAFRPNHL